MADQLSVEAQARILEEAVRRYFTPEVIAQAVRAVEATVMDRVREVAMSTAASYGAQVARDEIAKAIGRRFVITVTEAP